MIKTERNLNVLAGADHATPVSVTLPDGTVVAGFFHHLYSAPLESVAIRTSQGLKPFPLNLVEVAVN